MVSQHKGNWSYDFHHFAPCTSTFRSWFNTLSAKGTQNSTHLQPIHNQLGRTLLCLQHAVLQFVLLNTEQENYVIRTCKPRCGIHLLHSYVGYSLTLAQFNLLQMATPSKNWTHYKGCYVSFPFFSHLFINILNKHWLSTAMWYFLKSDNIEFWWIVLWKLSLTCTPKAILAPSQKCCHTET